LFPDPVEAFADNHDAEIVFDDRNVAEKITAEESYAYP